MASPAPLIELDSSDVPEGWRVVTLGEITKESKRRLGAEQAEVLSCSKLYGVVPQLTRFKKSLASVNTSRYKVVSKGAFVYDPMLLWDGSIGWNHLSSHGAVSPAYTVFEAVGDVDPEFLEFLLRQTKMRMKYRAISAGTNRRRQKAKYQDFASIQIALPPLEEQLGIAAALVAVQRAIRATSDAISATRGLKASLARHLFTYGAVPIGSESYVQTEEREGSVGPSHWDLRRVRDVAQVIVSTSTPATIKQEDLDDDGEKVLCLKVSDLGRADGQGFVHSAALQFVVSPSKVAKLKMVPAQATIFAKRGAAISTNRKRRAGLPSLMDPNLLAVAPHNINSGYLYRWFEAVDLASLVDPATLPQINKKDIGPLTILVPPEEEQTEVAFILDVVDRRIAVELDRHKALKVLFVSLLNELMSGRRRVTR